MTLYTRTGDTGITSLFGGDQVKKNDIILEVCGNIDELSSSLGIVRAEGLPSQFESIIFRVQQELIAFCAELISDSTTITSKHVRLFETNIDAIELDLAPLTEFIIPGKHRNSAMLHVSRTLCRRAERSLVTLCSTHTKSSILIAYLNRLGDLLFVMARKIDETCIE